MFYRIAADAMVVIHMAYVLFVVVGFLLTVIGTVAKWNWIRNPWFRSIHLLMILIVVFEAWLGITCPLTTWEQQLRAAAGQQTYDGAFVANLVHDWLFYDLPKWAFVLGYSLFGAGVVATWVFAPPKLSFNGEPQT